MHKNDQKNPSATISRTKDSLGHLHDHFNHQAATAKNALDMIIALEDALAEKDREIAALKNAVAHAGILARLENTKVTFLIDGSSSMGIKASNQKHSLLEVALESAQQFYLSSGQNKVSALLFGGTSGAVPVDLNDPVMIENAKKNGLRCGTELNPALAGLAPGKRKEHLLIIGDGDVYHSQAVQKTIEDMLAKNKNLHVDFIVIFKRSNPDIKKLQEAIAVADPARKPQLVQVDHQQGQEAVMQAVMRTLGSRVEQKRSPARKSPALPKAG